MQKIFLKYYDQVAGYYNFDKSQSCNFMLQDLQKYLEICGLQSCEYLYQDKQLSWENLHLTKQEDKIILWSSYNIKQQADIQFNTKKEQNTFSQAYSQYSKKRWDDMPKLEITLQNYEMILQKWNDTVLDQRPNYIILSQDDSGYIDLVGKDELSEQDLQDMKIEHEKYLKYKIAYDKYTKSRPDIVDDLWHGPESSEYEADWQKFLDEPLD